MRVKQIFAIDHVKSRLKIAQAQGARVINFNEVNPVEELKRLTKGKGPTRIIDAVGVDAEHAPHCSPAMRAEFKKEQKKIAPKTRIHDGNWIPGSGPSQVFRWAADAIAKNGIISIIGVYSDLSESFPIGKATGKNITIRMGDCNHRKYLPMLLSWVKNGKIDLRPFLTQKLPFTDVVEAYKQFDKREDNWLKVALTFGKK